MELNLFADINKELLTSIESLSNQGVHNFSYGILDSYFDVEKLVEKGKVELAENVLILSKLPGRSRKKVFVYLNASQQKLKRLQQEAVIYSISPLNLPKQNKFKELRYNLSKVFDPMSYSNAKKRYNRIKYPFVWLEKNNLFVEPLQRDKYNDYKELHDKWCEKKLEDPKTFKIMFPGKRYLRCVEKAIDNKDLYYALAFYLEDELVAIRVDSIEENYAFDLAFFGKFWEVPSQCMNYLNVYYMKAILDKGVEYLNCGAFLNKNLHTFKAHYPNDVVISYAYSKL